ncbi:hypothetical protein BHM03_00059435 [Ensete ventricosum]|nr:hypothetical protein BHM03_00059435 [Ensete ventricosum]
MILRGVTVQADDIVLPFAGAIPWEVIAVFVAEEDVPKLDMILTSRPTEIVFRKQRLLANPSMKQAMEFSQPARAGDAYHQILSGLAHKFQIIADDITFLYIF